MNNQEFNEIMLRKIPKAMWAEVVRCTKIAYNTTDTGTPMEYLFDVYEEFIDIAGEHEDWYCWACRNHILVFFQSNLTWLTEQISPKLISQ